MSDPNSRPLLSINIPTYNRAAYLRGLLDSIADDARVLGRQIEINVLDNASPDDTEAVVRSKPGGISLNYRRHASNVGAFQNIHLAHRAGSGRYVWVMGDDDFLRPGQLRRIVDALADSPGLVLLSYTRVTPDKRVIGDVAIGGQDRTLRVDDGDFDLSAVDSLIGFLSANIVERRWIDRFDAAAYEALDTRGELAHAAICYAAIAAGERIHYIGGSPLCQTADNGYLPHETWVHVCVDYCRYLPDELIRMGLDARIVKPLFTRRLLRECARRVLSEKYRGHSSSAVLRDRRVRDALGGRRTVLRALDLVPAWLLRRVHDRVRVQRA